LSRNGEKNENWKKNTYVRNSASSLLLFLRPYGPRELYLPLSFTGMILVMLNENGFLKEESITQ